MEKRRVGEIGESLEEDMASDGGLSMILSIRTTSS
jgi:hypothetical protein